MAGVLWVAAGAGAVDAAVLARVIDGAAHQHDGGIADGGWASALSSTLDYINEDLSTPTPGQFLFRLVIAMARLITEHEQEKESNPKEPRVATDP